MSLFTIVQRRRGRGTHRRGGGIHRRLLCVARLVATSLSALHYMNTSYVCKRSGWTLSYTVTTLTSIVDGHFKYAELLNTRFFIRTIV